jgi:hypothetical protein
MPASISCPSELRRAVLADLEKLARNNPLYVWAALTRECARGEPLPAWLEDYLHSLGHALLDLANQLAPTEAAKQAVKLVGLDRAAYADFYSASSDADLATKYEHRLGREPGTSESLLKKASEARGEGRATLLRRIARARKRWKAQE